MNHLSGFALSLVFLEVEIGLVHWRRCELRLLLKVGWSVLHDVEPFLSWDVVALRDVPFLSLDGGRLRVELTFLSWVSVALHGELTFRSWDVVVLHDGWTSLSLDAYSSIHHLMARKQASKTGIGDYCPWKIEPIYTQSHHHVPPSYKNSDTSVHLEVSTRQHKITKHRKQDWKNTTRGDKSLKEQWG